MRKGLVVAAIILALTYLAISGATERGYVEEPTPKIGVKCKIHFHGINVTDSNYTCTAIQDADNHTFTIQQNYFLKLSNGTVYWVQGGYRLCYNGTLCTNLEVYAREFYWIWRVTTTEYSTEVNRTTWGHFGNYIKVGKPSTFTLEIESYIEDTKVMMSGLQATPAEPVMDWENASVTGKIVTNPADTDVQKNNRWKNRNTCAQLVLVGYAELSTAEWQNCTSGWVEPYYATSLTEGVPEWVQADSAAVVKNDDHSTGEESHGMVWAWDPEKKRATFHYEYGKNWSGIAAPCVSPVDQFDLLINIVLILVILALSGVIVINIKRRRE